jgi:outer membrane lipoprotein-sorting protein
MGIRKENFIDGEFYHVYNAGVENITIFKDKDDFFQFLKMIKLFNNTISKGSSVNYKKNILPEKNSEEKVG